MMPDDIRWIGSTNLPWRQSSPLIFHVLTAFDTEAIAENRARFGELMERGACLAPLAERGSRLDGGVLEEDALAGDDRYIFLTVDRPLDAEEEVGNHVVNPAVAFTMEALLAPRAGSVSRRRRMGWRPHDLIQAYRHRIVNIDDRGDPTFSRSARAARRLADRWTIFDPAAVRRMLHLEHRLLMEPQAAGRIREEWERQIAGRGRLDPFVHPAGAIAPPKAWKCTSPIGASWPATVATSTVTEVVYAGRLPLRAAVAWRDPLDGWHPGPDEADAPCLDGPGWTFGPDGP
jgi:hypothetical protein